MSVVSHDVFTRLRVLLRHPRIVVFTVSTSLLFVAIHTVLSYTHCSLVNYGGAGERGKQGIMRNLTNVGIASRRWMYGGC